MRSVLIIHAIISRGRVLRLMSTVHVTQGVQYDGRPHPKVQRRVISQISLGRVLRLMAAGPLTRVCIQYNGRPRRYSCDYQPWAGHPPRNHGPRDTSYAFNIMVDLAQNFNVELGIHAIIGLGWVIRIMAMVHLTRSGNQYDGRPGPAGV